MQVAQEVDADDNASGGQYFDPVIIESLRQDVAMPPISIGDLIYDTETYTPVNWKEHKLGLMQSWITIKDGQPFIADDDEFSIGVDIAVGTGASNSVIHVINKNTRQTALELADSNIPPTRLAEITVALARWLNHAYLVWEANGPGRDFGNHVIELGYRNFYYRRKEESLAKQMSDIPGWWSTPGSKTMLFGEYSRAIETRDYTNLCEMSIIECMDIVYLPGGNIAHCRSQETKDPTGAKDNHADRVVASALAWKGVSIYRSQEEEPQSEEDPLPKNCPKRRRQEFEAKLEEDGDWKW